MATVTGHVRLICKNTISLIVKLNQSIYLTGNIYPRRRITNNTQTKNKIRPGVDALIRQCILTGDVQVFVGVERVHQRIGSAQPQGKPMFNCFRLVSAADSMVKEPGRHGVDTGACPPTLEGFWYISTYGYTDFSVWIVLGRKGNYTLLMRGGFV